jgi:hypothetical protein
MALFKKKKIEEITLPNLVSIVNEPVVMESSPKKEDTITTSLTEVAERHHYLERENEGIMNAYYICKIFSYIAIKDSDFEHQMNAIDKHIKRLENLHSAITEQVLILKSENTSSQETLKDVNEKIKEALLFHEGVSNILDDARNNYFNHLKIATLNVCLNRKNIELERMHRELVTFLKDYKSFDEAAQTIYYNSGQLIHQMIDELIKCLIQHKNERYIKAYPTHYFLKTDVVITLSFPEWIELYNRIKFVMKSAMDAKLMHCLDFRKYFDQFELRYLILMINLERSNQHKKN